MISPVLITQVDSPGHVDPSHPEHPGRFAHFDRWRNAFPAGRLTWLEAQPAQVEELARVHTPAMLNHLSTSCQRAGSRALTIDPAPTFVVGASWESALRAAGGGLGLVQAVLKGSGQRAFALVRPPGHHAEAGRSRGFCLLNNLAVGVAGALDSGLERVTIIDFDAHHGNGTQDIFWDEPRVGFFSSHQEHIYPGSGAIDEAPQARARLINLPLPAYAGDTAFEMMAELLLQPWLDRFKPQMLFISAGFDAHWTDPLTALGVTTPGYYRLAQRLVAMADEHCQGKIVFYLEGGYDPDTLADNVWVILAALTGSTALPEPKGHSPYREPDIRPRIDTLRRLHQLG